MAILGEYVVGLSWLLAIVKFAGLASAVAARRGTGTLGQVWRQWLFMTLLMLMGAATAITMTASCEAWVPCGATVAIMALIAVWEPRAVSSSTE